MTKALVIGSRGSRLALAQSRLIAAELTRLTGADVTVEVFSTRGDRIQDTPLPEIGGKGLFTMELEQALHGGQIDLAVHSLKDLPTEEPDGLVLGAVPSREDPRDTLVGCAIEQLPVAAVVATGSLRRRFQLLALRPDLNIIDIRGNVPTRLAKRDSGACSATILAQAGLNRLGIDRGDSVPFTVEQMVPAVGQGALGVQCRAGDASILNILSAIDDEETRACVEGERTFLREYGGGCNVPAGCHVVRTSTDAFRLIAAVGEADGTSRRFSSEGGNPSELGRAAAQALQ